MERIHGRSGSRGLYGHVFVVALTLAAACAVFSSAAADEPLLQLRLRMPDVRSDAEWASTFGIIRANPGCCDEVWFSTGIGYPPLAVHAERTERMKRAAEDLRPNVFYAHYLNRMFGATVVQWYMQQILEGNDREAMLGHALKAAEKGKDPLVFRRLELFRDSFGNSSEN